MESFDNLPPQDKRLQIEWLVINALRELMSLADPKVSTPTYTEVIDFAKDRFPQLFSKKSILGNLDREGELMRAYRQEAWAESQVSGRVVEPDALVELRIKKLEELVKKAKTNKQIGEVDQLRRELKKLKILREEFFKKKKRIIEDDAIRHDQYLERGRIITDNMGKSVRVRTNTGSDLELRILHNGKPEESIGADVIYEQYHPTEKKLRFVHIQYKIWDKGSLYFSQHKNLEPQLKKLHKVVCRGSFCCSEEGNNLGTGYRLPYCAAFLRPTDKLQNPKSSLASSGWHIPVCKIDKIAKRGPKNKVLHLADVRPTALSHLVFEEIFHNNMLGSRWLDIDEVEELYREHNILDSSEKIIIYAQQILLIGIRP